MTNKQLDLCIMQIATGNPEALRQLYDEMKKPIFKFALSLVKNYQSAEDVEQETFLKIMSSAANYQQGTNPKAWIFGIARHCCADNLKSQTKTVFLDDEMLLNIPSTDDFANKVINAEIAMSSLDQLDETERTIVTLYLYAELKQTEIAKILNMPYFSVRSKYGYALKKLKSYLAKKGVDNYE